MEYLNFGSRQITYQVKASRRRKSVAIAIDPAARVVVSVPHFLNRRRIEEVVRGKAKWILGKLLYFEELSRLYPEKEYVNGEEISFLGRPYRLKIEDHSNGFSEPWEEGRKLVIPLPAVVTEAERKQAVRENLRQWYLRHAVEMIHQRAETYQKFLDVTPARIIVKDQEKRWGSCSNAGIIRFNWKIIMAPIAVLDYVIVHELCHLKVQNHSSSFWKLVSSALPDYSKRRDWLRHNAPALRL